MSTEQLNEAIKTRVPKGSKQALNEIARARHLDLSDIIREALREYIAREKSARLAKQPA